jgi:hypothetical protein
VIVSPAHTVQENQHQANGLKLARLRVPDFCHNLANSFEVGPSRIAAQGCPKHPRIFYGCLKIPPAFNKGKHMKFSYMLCAVGIKDKRDEKERAAKPAYFIRTVELSTPLSLPASITLPGDSPAALVLRFIVCEIVYSLDSSVTQALGQVDRLSGTVTNEATYNDLEKSLMEYGFKSAGPGVVPPPATQLPWPPKP